MEITLFYVSFLKSRYKATHIFTRFINCQRLWSSYETFTEADIAPCCAWDKHYFVLELQEQIE